MIPNMIPNMIDVTLSRETATFSLPVSEARLPQSLQTQSLQVALRTAECLATDSAAGRIAAPENDGLSEDLDAVHAASNEHELTARDLALIGRMAPQAAE